MATTLNGDPSARPAGDGFASAKSPPRGAHSPSDSSKKPLQEGLTFAARFAPAIEGIARALRVYLGKEAFPVYRTLKPETLITMTVGKETALIRPYVVAAVLRNVKFTQQSYNSFIDLQVRAPCGQPRG